MIISHKYKFIYLRTEKTGSTSLVSVLKRLVADENVPEFQGSWEKYIPLRRNLYGSFSRFSPKYFGFHAHPYARHVREIVGSYVFDSYYKFTVERNPWEMQVSLYHHREFRRKNPSPNFDRDMKSAFYRLAHYSRVTNWDVYTIDNKLVADRVIRYESLEAEIGEVLAKLGVRDVPQLPKTNTSYSGERAHYSTYYSDKTRDLIAGWYRREIEALNYSFDDQRPKNMS